MPSSKPAPRTTDSIIQDLRDSLMDRAKAGEVIDVRATEQQIIAHQELARLRVQRADRVKAEDWLAVNDIDAKIQHWKRFIVEDVDDTVAGDPRKDATELVGLDPAEVPSGPKKA